LGEFFTIGRLFSLERILKIAEVAQILGVPFSTRQVLYVLNLIKIGLGYTLCDFFTNSSGHPV
jgi:hypothetical protein